MCVESIRVGVPAIILAAVVGCTSRPDAELADARAALEAAGEAEVLSLDRNGAQELYWALHPGDFAMIP